ncbi:ribonucleoside-diphosphate reductase subunit alpha [Halorubellus litoreus]|uniref:Ribonucleoside-diphosphate reductase n=1 Tax=Halorubellus litoreus TaxID=755308 RepID=A0ABD5VAM8_9EURY
MSHATADALDHRTVLDRARTGHDHVVTDAVTDELVTAAHRSGYDDATVDERYEALLGELTARVERHPAYDAVAARVARERLHHDVTGTVPRDAADPEHTADASAIREAFVDGIHRGVAAGELDERMAQYDLDALADALDPARSDRLDYQSVTTLHQRYVLRVDDAPIELPQAFWMRVAMGIALAEPESERHDRAREFYDVLSTLRFVHSTPTLFHAGTTHPQLSSCYLTTVDDDLDDIFENYGNHAKLSKWSGGLGNDWTPLRADGATIESTGVESTGVVPFLKISNDVTAAINRSGKRRGAACAYLAIWHLDYPAFVDLRRNTGDDRRRTHDLNTAAWIPDLFVERVRADEQWTLFSPDDVPELHETYGREFVERYEAAERDALADDGDIEHYERVDARDLWRTTLTRLFETGHPWVTFKDPCNVRSPQDHAGVVHSSNLCTEVTLNTSGDETAVCNVGSVNLARHVDADGVDRDRLADTVSTAMRMLDDTVDLNFYPTENAERSNTRHRPVGLGVMGFHEALFEQSIPMASDEAVDFADRAQELLAYHAIRASTDLAAERGTYDSYEGSKWDRGLLPQDTLELLERERGREIPVDVTERLDWDALRERVDEHGMRHSNTMAIAPTATISTIAGTTASIEPVYANLHVQSNMSGDFTRLNDHLVADLEARGLWDDETRDLLKYHDGSVQPIDRVPDDLQELYRGAFEIDPRHQLDLTAARATWIDQSQSHNVFFPSTDGSELADIYQHAWELGLKTTYYLRTLGASQFEKSTLDVSEYDDTQRRGRDESTDTDRTRDESTDTDRTRDDSDLPTVEDPTCDACQ